MKIKKYEIITFFALIIITFFSCISVFAAENTTEFFGGDGTENNPYIIGRKEHLNNVRKYPDAHFIMVADITFDEADFAEGGDFYNQGEGWEPIPTFSGTFDGGGKTIYGLTITAKDPASGMVGLFGLNEGIIKSLNIEGITCKINDNTSSIVYVGGIVAYNDRIVKNCNVKGEILYSKFADETVVYIGGISGLNTGTIQNCSNIANLSGGYRYSYVYNGGISGHNKGIISSCYNMGNIGNCISFGGIVGTNEDVIKNCFNLGLVQSRTNDDESIAGGICATNSGIVSTSYNAALVKTDGDNPSIYISTGTIENCYYYSCSLDWGDFSGGLTKEQMKTEQTFDGFDFVNDWTFDENSGYPFPVLKGATKIPLRYVASDLFNGGSGCFWDPYEIATTEQLANIKVYPDACYKLTENILMTGSNWEAFDFSGGFDGNGNTITYKATCSPETTNSYSSMYYGIFDTNKGIICNVNIKANLKYDFSEKNASIYVGALVAYNSGVIRNSTISGSVNVYNGSSGFVFVGGVCATNLGIITDCRNSSVITADCLRARAGGIVGYGEYGTITDCANTGNITAIGDRHSQSISNSAGGIASYIMQSKVLNCINSGKISAKTNAYKESGFGYSGAYLYSWSGGIVGWWSPPDNTNIQLKSEIINCTNTGNVSAATTSTIPAKILVAFSGGICGNAGYVVELGGPIAPTLSGVRPCYISHCRNNGTVSASDSFTYNTSGTNENIYAGAISGACYGTVTNCYNTGTTYGGIGNATNSYDAGTSSSSSKLSQSAIDNSSSCYYLKGTPSQRNIELHSDEEMLRQDTYSGFDFEKDWIMLPGTYPYPQLRNNLATPIKSIHIAQHPSAPLECVGGYFISYNGLKIEILFEDGTSVTTDPWSECFSLLDINSKGTHSIPLTVLGCKTDDFVDIIVRDKLLASIAVETQPTKTRYFIDEETISLDGAVLKLIYDDTSTETIAITYDMISGFIPGVVGTQTLIVTYDDKVCHLYITVYEASSISIKTTPSKTNYVQGQPISSQGGVLTVKYSDGVEKDFSLDVAELDYPKNLTGNIQATVKYLGFATSFPITVNDRIVTSVKIETEPSTAVYFVGEELDLSGGTIKVDFESDDNYYEIIPIDKSMVSGFDSSQIGYPTITVTYENKTDNFLVRVREYDSSFTQLTLTRSNNEIVVYAKRVPDFAVVFVAQYDINGKLLSLYTAHNEMKINIETNMYQTYAFLWNKNNISPYCEKVILK